VLAVGFAVMALCAANPQPWYLLWAVPLVACTFGDGSAPRAALSVMCAMVAWSVLPFGALLWFTGIIALLVIFLGWRPSWQWLGSPPWQPAAARPHSLTSNP
jgi:hypothetical protein